MLNEKENEIKTKNTKSKHTTEGIIALIFGIIGIIMMFVNQTYSLFFGIIAIITGFMAKQKDDIYGKYGLFLGIIIIIVAIITIIAFIIYLSLSV